MHGSSCTPESENGTAELSVTFRSAEVYEIVLGTELSTLTDLTISYLKDWLGYHNQQSLQSALEQLLILAKKYPGVQFSCKFTTQWYSKFLTTDLLLQALRKFEKLSTLQYRTPIRSESPGA